MPRRAVLLANLGSPDSPSIPDVRNYLREFLGDDRVLDAPRQPLRWLLLEGIILRLRPKKSAHAYAAVWTKEGSPLIATSLKVRQELAESLGSELHVYLAMRYRKPSIPDVVGQMKADGITEVLLIPQYPHYAMSSWETVVAQVYQEAVRQAPEMHVDCVQPFYDDPAYIEVLFQMAQAALSRPYDHILFSYHGLPERHLRKADSSRSHCLTVQDCCTTCSPAHGTCYRAQCMKTTAAFARRAGLDPAKYSMSFQSRLAGEPWLRPFTDHELERLPKAGVKNLLVMCPSFVADCLETLEEIRMAGRELFINAGGQSFEQISCPNDHRGYVDFLALQVHTWVNSNRANP